MRRRVQEFVSQQQGSQVPLSMNLVTATCVLLAKSLEVRKGGVWKTKDNHAADCAPGAIVMAVSAFDAWLNEIAGFPGAIPSQQRLSELIEMTTKAKYRALARATTGIEIADAADLGLLIDVRNEIVHFLPYIQRIDSGETVPERLGALEKKKLLIISGDPSADFHFSQKLCSYALAYWACETTRTAAETLAEVLGPNTMVGSNARVMAGNFAIYRRLPGPADLEEWDAVPSP